MTATISGSAVSTLVALTTTGNTILGDASTDTLNVGNGGLVKDASGNVGIGTVSPATKLDVVTSTNNGIRVSDGTYTGTFVPSSLGGMAITTGGAYPLIYYINGAERAQITSGGVFQVGTSNGAIQINPAGAQGYAATITLSSRGLEFDNNSGIRDYYFTKSSGTVYAPMYAASYNVSDYRLKENIVPFTNALAKVAQLKPSQFNFKADIKTKMPYGESTVAGFIAHELAEVLPYAVHHEKDQVDTDGNPVFQGIEVSSLIPILTAAIQELKAIVDAQGAEIATLTAAIQEQQALITSRTDRITALENK